MIRIFLKVYFFLLIPLVLFSLLPENPLRIIGYRLGEYNDNLEFGATYKLIDKQLGNTPESNWAQTVERLSKHFAYALELVELDSLNLSDAELERLDKQGYIREEKAFPRLLYRMRDTSKVLIVGMYPNDSELQLIEKQTRGMRYLIEQAMYQNPTRPDHPDPVATFNELKTLFSIPLAIKSVSAFDPKSKIMQELNKNGIAGTKSEKAQASPYYSDPEYLYFLTTSRDYVVVAGPLHNLQQFRNLFRYLYLIIPALLISLGLLVWLFTIRREITTLNKAAQQLGTGQLDARVKLPRFSTLHLLGSAFNQMAGRIQQLINGHRTLTNDISHELKTPISRLRFALTMQQEASNKADRKKYTRHIESNIQELEKLIDELLNHARLEREQTEKSLQPHYLGNWLKQQVSQFADYHPAIELQLNISDSANQPVVFDKNLLARALQNLMQNAARHTKSIIRISAKVDNNTASICVEDNGNGIPKAERENIFAAFTRLDKSRQRKSGGYGLGLSIARRIAQAHQGTLVCQDSDLGGAKFVLQWSTQG